MARPKFDNVGSLTRAGEVVSFGTQYDGETQHRWVCSCGVKGQWYNRAHRKTHLFRLWQGHLARKHPEHSTDFEDLDKEAEDCEISNHEEM